MLLNLHDYAKAARDGMDPVTWDFFAGGSGDEWTLADNAAAFDDIPLIPRVLCGAAGPDPTIDLFGRPLSMPILAAPTAFHRLVHPEGEPATARGTGAAGTVMIVSMPRPRRSRRSPRPVRGCGCSSISSRTAPSPRRSCGVPKRRVARRWC